MPAQLTLAPFYKGWKAGNGQLVSAIRPLTREQLLLRPAPDIGAIWQIVAHMAGARAWWFSNIGETEAELGPLYADPETGMGWEDFPDQPRSAEELVWALEASWRLIESRLDRWTPDMLDDRFSRVRGPWAGSEAGQEEHFTRQEVIWRLIAHDGEHSGEVSLILGINGLGAVNFWWNF
jgi:uncharacterized damage-inducible protein DinB